MKFDPHCIFCKIVKGEASAMKVYEDEAFIAFLDKFPRSTGHCQVIPKDHHRWVWDVPEIGRYMEAARRVAQAQRKAFGTEMIVSSVIGDEVPHAHIWLVPQRHTKNERVSDDEAARLIRENME
jgi:histidine triad (HIT) family protein